MKRWQTLRQKRDEAYKKCPHPNKHVVGGPLDRYHVCPDCGWEG